MNKKIGDLTLSEIQEMCNGSNCSECSFIESFCDVNFLDVNPCGWDNLDRLVETGKEESK